MFTFCQDMLLLAIRDPMRGEERVWYRSTWQPWVGGGVRNLGRGQVRWRTYH
jgi:hypothetical protein